MSENHFLASDVEQHYRALLEAEKAKVAELERDRARLDWFEQDAAEGGCSSLINDDAGRWAVSGDGMQNLPEEDGPGDISTCFFIEKHQWRDSVRGAIDAVMETEA